MRMNKLPPGIRDGRRFRVEQMSLAGSLSSLGAFWGKFFAR
jgi:hypothetical protein